MKLILASSSPRRAALLASIGLIPHDIKSPDVDESVLKHENVHHYVERLARLKARVIHQQTLEAYVLAADTIVEIGGKIISKPEDEEDARTILGRLSGRRHRVYTGVCVVSPEGKEACRVVQSRLSLKRFTEEELKDYLASGEWEGRAGAISIQGRGAPFVKFISGSYTNVVGLPLYETVSLLRGLGFRG